MTKKVEQIYKKLTEIEHVLKRPGRYIGAVAVSPFPTYYIENGSVKWDTLSYNPAFIKLFDEIISNSADFSKRPEGKHLNKIEVEINNDTISVYDNGGIPVVMHKEYKQYVPDMIFGELRSGSNFDDADDSVSTGQNGEGSTLTNIFSKDFTVDTADGKNRFLCTYHDNMSHKDVPKVTKSAKNYTKITYLPDYEKLAMPNKLDRDHTRLIERRVYEVAATNPHLKVYLNGKLLPFKSFKDYAAMFSTERVDFGNENFQASVFHSKNGFQQIGFVNSTNVSQGGTHIEHLMNQIVTGIRDHVKKKTKQDIKPSDIRNHFFLMSNSTINNPRYNSQTKEKLETLASAFGKTMIIDDKTIQKIIKSDIVEEIILWAENKQALEEMAALRAKNKEAAKSGNSLRDITKYEPATSKNRSKCSLFIAEGDSAAKALQSARNPEFHGIFPFKGKPVNVRGMKIRDLIANVELDSLMKILGLQLGKKHFISELRYHEMVIATDQDLDGFHLAGLIFNIFQELWPDLLKQGFLFKLQTPIVRVLQNKKEIEFLYMNDYVAWEAKQSKNNYSVTYLKGLGSNDTKYFKKYMFEPEYKVQITFKNDDDKNALDIAFDKKKADERKIFIYGEA